MRPTAAALISLTLALPSQPRAFRDSAIGTPVRNRDLPSIDGRRVALLGDARANVFVFVRTGQEHTVKALHELAALEREVAGKPVRFVAIVSDGDPRDEVLALVRETGIRMPVLVDAGDALYGELGVMLHPSAGIADARHRLVGYQPFRQVNFLDAMRGRVALALGEIDDAALARILDPGAAPVVPGGRARARLRLARALLDAGRAEAAAESARAAVALDPQLAEAHQVLADALAKAGRCTDAEKELGEAHRLAPAAPSPALACAKR